MYVAPRLFVGRADTDAHYARAVPEAVDLIKGGATVVVATTDLAYDVLIALGATPEHALRSTTPLSSLTKVEL